MELSPDQAAALDACLASLHAGEETVLVGPAGSGKTTLMKSLLAQLPWPAVLACPTGKAARRLAQATGTGASTVHGLMYGPPDENADDDDEELRFSGRKQRLGARSILVVDEASMLGSKIAADLRAWLPAGCRRLFVGDREQLEPVKDTWGVDLLHPTAALTQVHRQALENPIIHAATEIRQGRGDDWMRAWATSGQPDPRVQLTRGMSTALDWYMELRDTDAVMLAFTHRTRERFNELARARMGFRAPVCVGDRLLVRQNAPMLGLMNGDVIRVASVAPARAVMPEALAITTEDGGEYVLNLRLLNGNPGDFWKFKRQLSPWDQGMPWIHVWHGDCITVHSSQGSQWGDVGFLWDASFGRMRAEDPESSRRLLYTAVTRAAERLAIFAGGDL